MINITGFGKPEVENNGNEHMVATMAGIAGKAEKAGKSAFL